MWSIWIEISLNCKTLISIQIFDEWISPWGNLFLNFSKSISFQREKQLLKIQVQFQILIKICRRASDVLSHLISEPKHTNYTWTWQWHWSCSLNMKHPLWNTIHFLWNTKTYILPIRCHCLVSETQETVASILTLNRGDLIPSLLCGTSPKPSMSSTGKNLSQFVFLSLDWSVKFYKLLKNL